jgi:hypothetical protein
VGNLSGENGDVPEGGQPIEEVPAAKLVAALHAVIKAGGLPTSEKSGGDLLVNLRSVYARAVVPADAHSRLAALNELLPRLIATIGDPLYREALQILFALAPGSRGTNLTTRQRRAAELLDYSFDHFRDEIQAQLLNSLATLIQDDLLRYRRRVRRTAESLEPTGDTPRLGSEHLTHEEELVSRIWQHVYAVRAETIASLRLSAQEGYEGQVEDHRQALKRQQAELQRLLKEYVDTYGKSLIKHGEAEFGVEALERLARWSS